jgi:hypothetical protein
MADGAVEYKVEYDTKNADKDVDKLDKSLGKADKSFGKVGKAAVAASALIVAGIAAFAGKALEAAANVEEMQNKFNVVFDGMTKDVEDWATAYAASVGRSKNDTKGYLADISDLLIGMGNTKEGAFDLSKNIITLATDLASFNNVNDDVAIEAVSKAMMGEADSAKQLGLLLNVDRVKEYADAQGLIFAELTDAEKAQVTFDLALSQSQNALGDAERSSGSYTNQMKALKAEFSDFMAEAGKPLIAVATDIVGKLREMVTWAGNNEEKLTRLVVTVGGLAATIIIASVAIKAARIVTQAWTAATVAIAAVKKAYNLLTTKGTVATIAATIADNASTAATWLGVAALTAWEIIGTIATVVTTALGAAFTFLTGPIGLIILAVIAVIAIVVLLVKNWDFVKEKAIEVWGSIKDFFKKTWDSIMGFFKRAWDFIKDLFFKFHPLGIIIKNWQVIIDWFKGLGGKIKDIFTNMIEKAKTWGKDMMDAFINGIKEKIQAIKDMVANVADIVKDFLGFSVPNKGALSTFDESGGDMIDLFGESARKKMPSLLKGLKGMAMGINTSINPLLAPAGGGHNISSSSSSIIMDGRVVGEVVMQHVDENVRFRG